jgi:hypothetical protein
MLKKKIVPRRLQPETDAKELINLFEEVFGETITPDMWKWKYRPPWSEHQTCWVGTIDEKIIGYVGAVPLRGYVEGKVVPFFQLADAMVHPKHRRRFDYFDLALQAILADVCDHHPEHLLYGFSDHRAFLWFKRKGLGGLVEKPSTGFVQPDELQGDDRFQFEEWAWKATAIDELWDQRKDFTAGLVRDAMYLHWRYGSHPAWPYRLFGVLEAEKPVGWAVVGANKPGKGKKRKGAPVVDLLLPNGSTVEILQGLSRHLEYPLKTWLPRRLGHEFSEQKETGTHLYHFVQKSVVDTDYLQRNLYYTMGDVDWW